MNTLREDLRTVHIGVLISP